MHTRKFIALVAALGLSALGWAQNVVLDLQKEATLMGNNERIERGENVTFEFIGSSDKKGAVINGGYWTFLYYMKITAPRDIAVIEYQTVVTKSSYNNQGVASTGSLEETYENNWVWTGPGRSVTIEGLDANSIFRISRIRLWYDAKDYVPNTPWDSTDEGGGSGRPYEANVTFVDDKTNYSQVDRVYGSVKVLPVNGRGVPMAVVSAPKFKDTLKSYLEWKTQQGYEVTDIYTDEIPGNLRGKELAHALRRRLMDMRPRPSYVLLVGGADEVPVFYGVTHETTHAADCYYGEFTDDHFADAYVGRFSATTPAELKAQMDKTQYMAFLSPNEGDWLRRSVTVNAVEENIAAMNESVVLSLNYPYNFKDNTTLELKPTYPGPINNSINTGCSFVNYFGHGLPTSWNGAYTTAHVAQLNNRNRYPVVLSITCLTGMFDVKGGLAEAFMRRENAGAVACIAASRNSYAHTNNYMFLGHKGNESKAESIGLFRSMFPFAGSDPSQRARTIGQAMDIGLMAVARAIPGDYASVGEFYNLLGDPTYQPYITTPKANKLSASSYNMTAGSTITVNTVPDAMVCLSQGRQVIVAGVADEQGVAKLHIPLTKLSGECTLYSSAPGYHDLLRRVTLSPGNGTEQVSGTDVAQPRVTHTDVISLATVGQAVSINDWYSDQRTFVGTESGAQYAIVASTEKYRSTYMPISPWLDTNAGAKGLYLRNQHDPCSIITTRSGGKARTVEVEWLYPAGIAEVIGVYGKKSQYYNTKNAWTSGSEGDKLGELIKGVKDSLVLSGDYTYLSFRAEPRVQFPGELSEAYIRQLSIGWEKAMTACDKPRISYADGFFRFSCTTPGATYRYGVVPATLGSSDMVLTVVAEAPGHASSAQATYTIPASQLQESRGDIDGNGDVSISDLVRLIKSLNTTNK